jgi:hypothetical protein
MTDLSHGSEEYESGRKDLITGRQSYHLAVPGTANAKDLSVVLYRAREIMGDAYRIPITLTHPDELNRADYLKPLMPRRQSQRTMRSKSRCLPGP